MDEWNVASYFITSSRVYGDFLWKVRYWYQNHLPEEKVGMGTVITENIKHEILSWTGVTSNPYQYGGVEFHVNKRDMGHIHGEKLG